VNIIEKLRNLRNSKKIKHLAINQLAQIIIIIGSIVFSKKILIERFLLKPSEEAT
jgi:hypothetical protein